MRLQGCCCCCWLVQRVVYTVHCTNTFYIYLVGLLLVSVEGGVHCALYKYILYLFSRVVVGQCRGWCTLYTVQIHYIFIQQGCCRLMQRLVYTVHCTNTFYIYLVGLFQVNVEGVCVHCTLYFYIYILLVMQKGCC